MVTNSVCRVVVIMVEGLMGLGPSAYRQGYDQRQTGLGGVSPPCELLLRSSPRLACVYAVRDGCLYTPSVLPKRACDLGVHPTLQGKLLSLPTLVSWRVTASFRTAHVAYAVVCETTINYDEQPCEPINPADPRMHEATMNRLVRVH